jgi:hypothetical protein
VLAHQRLRLGNHPEVQLVLEAHRPQEPQRVVLEHGGLDGTDAARGEIAVAVVGIDDLAGAHPLGDRVDREVAGGEVVLDRPAQGREVDGTVVREGDAPGPVPLGERERRALDPVREPPRRLSGLPNHHVEVEHRPFERSVANGAADDPGVLAGEQLLDQLTHRLPPAALAAGRR